MENVSSLSFRNTNCPAMYPCSVSLFFSCVCNFAKDRGVLQRCKSLGGNGTPSPPFLEPLLPKHRSQSYSKAFLGEDPLSKSKPDSYEAVLDMLLPIISALALESREMDNLLWSLGATGETFMWTWAHPPGVIKKDGGKTNKQKGLTMAMKANLMRLVYVYDSSSFPFHYSHSINWKHSKYTKFLCKLSNLIFCGLSSILLKLVSTH